MQSSNFKFFYDEQTSNYTVFWKNEKTPIIWETPVILSHIINTVYAVTESIDGRFKITSYMNGREIIQNKETLEFLIL